MPRATTPPARAGLARRARLGARASACAVLAALASAPASALADEVAAGTGALASGVRVRKSTLEGGLRVVVSPMRGVSSVAVALARPPEAAPPDEASRLVASRGGRTETRRTENVSLSVTVLPASELALALWAQRERLRASHADPKAKAPVLVIAGDVDVDEALALSETWLEGGAGARSAGSKKKRPPREAERSRRLSRVLAHVFDLPAGEPGELGALALAARVAAARLEAKLGPGGRGLVRKAEAKAEGGRLRIEVEPSPGAKGSELRRLVEAELSRLAASPPTEEELGLARRDLETEALTRLGSAPSRAALLADAAFRLGDPRAPLRRLEQLGAARPEDVRRAAETHLAPSRARVEGDAGEEEAAP